MVKADGRIGGVFPRWAVAVFAAFMLSIAGTAIAPVAARLAAPIVCPNGYESSGVVTKVSHPGAGQTQMTWTLYCIDSSGTLLATNQLVVMLVLFVVYVPPAWAVLWLVTRGPGRKADRPWEGT